MYKFFERTLIKNTESSVCTKLSKFLKSLRFLSRDKQKDYT